MFAEIHYTSGDFLCYTGPDTKDPEASPLKRTYCFFHILTVALGLCLAMTFLFIPGYTRGERIALDALSHLDAPYVFAEAGPDRFDCSGLLLHCFGKHGLELPHSAEIIGYSFPTIEHPRQLLVGDIVCFDTVNDRDPSDHVGIWLGGNAFVHASSGKGKVIISQLEGYYLEHFTGGRRLICPYF